MEDLQSPPRRRRRSTFFERRESFAPQPMITETEANDTNVCKQNTEADAKNLEDLSRYYDKLLSEKAQWKNEVKNRRNKYHDIKQQYQMALDAPRSSKMPYSALTNEDIEFLKARTNISKLVDSQAKLRKSVKETRALYRRASELEDVILRHCEDKVNTITEYILENSTVELKD